MFETQIKNLRDCGHRCNEGLECPMRYDELEEATHYSQVYRPHCAAEEAIKVIEELLSELSGDTVHCFECKHRDPEDKKCDCGELERAGCIFPVKDDYFCKYGER